MYTGILNLKCFDFTKVTRKHDNNTTQSSPLPIPVRSVLPVFNCTDRLRPQSNVNERTCRTDRSTAVSSINRDYRNFLWSSARGRVFIVRGISIFELSTVCSARYTVVVPVWRYTDKRGYLHVPTENGVDQWCQTWRPRTRVRRDPQYKYIS